MRTFKRGTLCVLACMALAAATSCDTFGPEEPSGPGSIYVDLVSPNGDEGSAVFQLSGGVGLGEITSNGAWVFTEPEETGMRIVVLMTRPGPIQFQVVAQDVNRLPEVSLIQVAGPDNQLRESLDGYVIELFPLVGRRIP